MIEKNGKEQRKITIPTLELPNGDRVKDASAVIWKHQTVKQVRENLLWSYFNKNNDYDTVLQIPTPDGKTKFLPDDDRIWKYEKALRTLKKLELSYISSTPLFGFLPTPFGFSLGLGMVTGNEAELMSIDMEVHFPNKLVKTQALYLLDSPVEDTKVMLLEKEESDLQPYKPYEEMMMEMHFMDKDPEEMFDNKKLRDYIADLSKCIFVELKKKPIVIL